MPLSRMVSSLHGARHGTVRDMRSSSSLSTASAPQTRYQIWRESLMRLPLSQVHVHAILWAVALVPVPSFFRMLLAIQCMLLRDVHSVRSLSWLP